jgi:hypothetical protein
MDTLRSASHLQRELGDELFAALVSSDNTAKVKEFAQSLVAAKSVKRELFPSEKFAEDIIPPGYQIVEDVAPTLKSVDDLEFLPILEEGEISVSGEEMRRRAKAKRANLGLADLVVVLRDLRERKEISSHMQGNYITFSGTVLRRPGGGLYVAFLGWDGGRWVVVFRWLADDWNSGGRLPHPK